jgi:uncharacterized membrane protein
MSTLEDRFEDLKTKTQVLLLVGIAFVVVGIAVWATSSGQEGTVGGLVLIGTGVIALFASVVLSDSDI